MEAGAGSLSASAGRRSISPGSVPRFRSLRRKEGQKHRGLTCANCRARKIRCEGSQPTCKTCDAYHEKCRYEKLPHMSQILAMAKQLQEAEQTIAELRRAAHEAAPNAPHHSYAPIETEPVQSREVSRQFSGPVEDTPRSRPGSAVSSPEEVLPDLSLDRDGKICFYGPNSAVHDPPASGTPLPQASNYETHARALLAAKASEARVWEGFALGRAAIQRDTPRQVIAKLLSIHWTWTSPMFMWVYRPAFTYDMSTGGPYYSEFLLIVLCAHAARFCDLRIAVGLKVVAITR